MRKRVILGSLLSASAILLVGWEVGATAHTIPATVAVTTSAPAAHGSPQQTGTAAHTTTPGTAPTTPTSTSASDGTFLGSSASTRFGQVQVQVTISGGTITDVTAVHLTDADGHSVQISNRAAPVLRQEVLSAQSANVQIVSGATYTSDGYLSSLQSALDQAGF